MGHFFSRVVLFLFVFLSLNCIKVQGQQHTNQSFTLSSGTGNYKTFTDYGRFKTDEVFSANKGYEQHPEVGVLLPGAPCTDCYELIGNRTENSKTFIKANTNGRDVMQQTASGPLHYKGPNGEWLTIKSGLRPDLHHKGVFAATEQEAPVQISTTGKFSSLGKDGVSIQFNRNLELVFAKSDGTEQVLGSADYSHYTAGDDGVYITNAWEGIDIEMLVVRGAVKTNFIINHAMPVYAGGSLMVRDHMQLSAGLQLYVPGENRTKHIGDLQVKKADGANLYAISAAVAFEKAAGRGTLQMLAYKISGSDVDIILPGNFLNRAASSYPVIIDPLVSLSTSTTVTGSKYSPSWTTGCSYPNAASVPAKVTVTDVQFSFQYIASGGALTNNGAYDFKLGTCRSPYPSSLYWNCSSGLPGTCDAVGATIFAGQIAPCIPAPRCTAYDLNLVMDFYQNYSSSPGCSPTFISAGTPLTITVFGRTVESAAIIASASSICQGQSTVMIATSLYGVPPYTYIWTPGGTVGANDTVSPATTTTYTVTSTDACGSITTATKTINVNPVNPIGGVTTICAGGTSTLTGSPAGGTWASSAPSIAPVGSSSGIVSGIGLGNATITYTTTAGCTTTTTVNVIVPVAPITGYMVVCQGSTTTLSNATPGGTWSSSPTSIGTVASTGVATGISGGLASITYATYGGGCFSTATLTVNPTSAITGTTTICVGGTTTLSNGVSGGTWSSSNPAVATIGASSGVVNGASAGTATITYTTPAGCIVTSSVAVNLLSPITGTTNVCQGNTTTLTNGASGGSWSSSNSAVATIGSGTGVVTGVSGGAAVITYTLPGGCFATAAFTVNPVGPVSGTTTLCTGGSATLTNIAGPGTWSSSNPAVATIGASSGIVTGVTVGSATITYTSSAGCTATVGVNVGLPTPITGTTIVCQGSNTSLSNSTTGGTWSSANPAIATIGGSSGIATGVTAGTAAISYTTPSGCVVTAALTVNANPPISGAANICVGSSTTLGSAASGGTWSSATPGVATVGASSGVVSGVAIGTAAISYTTTAGCIATLTVTVNVPAPITGSTTVCQGITTTLSNATPGGTWSSSNPAVASVGATTGVVSGVSGGVVTISYNTPGGCNATAAFTVNPVSPVTGTTTMCSGNSSTLSNATPGGSWSSTDPSVATVGTTSGVVTGVSAGTATIVYTTSAGCTASVPVIINPSPSAIGGSTLVCTTTTLTNAIGGGIWSSSSPSIAAITPTTGVVTGIGPGTVTITYTLSGGCFTTILLTVNPLASISGVPSVCQGTTTTLSYPQPGGTWNSMNPSVATVDPSTGVVTGVAPGTVIIKYTTPTGCAASVNVTVYALLPNTGTPTVCQGNTTTLSNAVPGGSFTSSNPSVATIGAISGIVSGVSTGTTTINYTTSAGCVATTIVTVNPLLPTVGPSAICAGSTASLSNAVAGGTWNSTAPSVASVDPTTGLATGLAAGTANIVYTTPAGCTANHVLTVNAMPSAIVGSSIVCQGGSTTLTNTLPGGTWSSSNPAIASVGAGTGSVTGIAAGNVTISYITSAGCFAAKSMTVNASSPITGIPAICAGATTTLANAVPGGTWSSSLPSVATVDPVTGLVTGITSGVTTIQYTTGLGCVSTLAETVNPLPSAIGGIPRVCVSNTTVLTNTLTGGTWSSSNPAIATVTPGTGIVSGISAGMATITYTSSAGCRAMIDLTVNPLPAAITGITSICQGETVTLSDATPGGTWSSSLPSIASIGVTTGFVSGVSAGAAMITYTAPNGCLATTPFMVNPVPPAITGTPVVCEGASTTLFNTLPGGLWYSSNLAIATMGASAGVLTGVSAGTANITYITAAGCYTVITATVNETPVINSTAFTNPTTCVTADGTITLTGLNPGETYTVNYTAGTTPVTLTLTATGAGEIKITGLAAGTYTNFNLTTALGCTSATVAGPVVLVLPPAPPAPVAANNAPVCEGSALNLTATNTVPGVTYSWTGPAGFTSTLQNPVLNPAAMSNAGTYTVTATILSCVSAPATTTVIIHPIPAITNITYTHPSTCQGTQGTITLEGLLAGVSYEVNYSYNGSPVSVTVVANASGRVVITGLAAGSYTGFYVTSFTCPSNTVGPVTLKDPNPPPVPRLLTNSPICTGRTLTLDAIDDVADLTYEWNGPNGFTSAIKNPEIPGVTLADSGLYTLTIRHRNCPTTASVNVVVYPPAEITYITPDHVIPLGSSIGLRADGGVMYVWSPNNGTISNPNVDSTMATPEETTVYRVQAMNIWGCVDTAEVTITVDNNVVESVPNAFTPNGDGLNDVFKVANIRYSKLVDFSVFNRWGQLVYHNQFNVNDGWDGTFNNVPQDMGVYHYSIILSEPGGKLKHFKGDVALIR